MKPWTDERIERFIGALLRAGVVTASALILAGALVYAWRHGAEQPDYQVFRGTPRAPRGIVGVAREAADLRGRGLIQLGVLVLVATPVVRVGFSVLAFAAQRDHVYVAIALAVLAVLGFSLFGTPV